VQFLKINLEKHLKKKNMTQKELAKKIGCSETHLSQVLNGSKRPSMGLLEKAAVELDTSIAELLKDPFKEE
jgi:transcriptional regulator with XRE-family HTH domain